MSGCPRSDWDQLHLATAPHPPWPPQSWQCVYMSVLCRCCVGVVSVLCQCCVSVVTVLCQCRVRVVSVLCSNSIIHVYVNIIFIENCVKMSKAEPRQTVLEKRNTEAVLDGAQTHDPGWCSATKPAQCRKMCNVIYRTCYTTIYVCEILCTCIYTYPFLYLSSQKAKMELFTSPSSIIFWKTGSTLSTEILGQAMPRMPSNFAAMNVIPGW